MLNEQELIEKQMEKTRGSLTEKLEALEGQVAETVNSTAGAVHDTTQTVQETVTVAVDAVKETVTTVTDKVQETMETVTDKLQETVQSVADTFNPSVQMQRHPWIMLGGAVAVGYFVGSAFAPLKKPQFAKMMAAASPAPAPPPWTQPARVEAEAPSHSPQKSGIWSDAMEHVKDIGLSYLMGLIRDIARRGLPDVLATRVSDEVDALTKKMGASPIPGPVLPEGIFGEKQSSDTDPSSTSSDKGKSAYRGRSPVGATAN